MAAAKAHRMHAIHLKSDKIFKRKPTKNAIAKMNPRRSKKNANIKMAIIADQIYR